MVPENPHIDDEFVQPVMPDGGAPVPADGPSARILPFILATIFIDSVGFGVIMPVLPDLVMDIGRVDANGAISIATWIGVLMALCSFVAAPVLGNMSDRFGRRPILLIALGGLAIDYLLLSVVQTLPWLFIARALSGIFGGSYAAAQAAIADITAPEQRARNFGMVGAAFGVGFIAGPLIGGLLGEYGPRAPFMLASALAAINFIYGFFFFPDTLPKARRRSFSWARANPLGALKVARAVPGVLPVALVLVLWQIASLVYPMTWSFYAIVQLGWSSSMIGISLTAVGVIIAASQMLLTGPLVKRLGERNAASFGLIFACTGYIGYAFITDTLAAFVLMLILALQSPVQPSLMAMLSRRATPETQGEMQGVAAMAMGLGSLPAPLVLTGAMDYFTGPGAPLQFPGAAFIVALLFALLALALLRSLPGGQAAQDGSAP